MPEGQAVFAPVTLTHISAPYLHYVVTSLRFICYNNTHHIIEMKTNQLKVITFIRQHGKKIDHYFARHLHDMFLLLRPGFMSFFFHIFVRLSHPEEFWY